MNVTLQLPPPDGFGNRLKRARLLKGMTCAELGELVGTSRTAIGRWEKGGIQPQIRTFRTLSRILGVSQTWLAYGEETLEGSTKNEAVQPAPSTSTPAR